MRFKGQWILWSLGVVGIQYEVQGQQVFSMRFRVRSYLAWDRFIEYLICGSVLFTMVLRVSEYLVQWLGLVGIQYGLQSQWVFSIGGQGYSVFSMGLALVYLVRVLSIVGSYMGFSVAMYLVWGLRLVCIQFRLVGIQYEDQV